MDKRLKITEIAARTQLSISTVSRVLAGKANTSEKARAKVLACARELGVIDGMAAGRLLLNTLVVFAPQRAFDERSDIFYYRVIQSVSKGLASHEVRLRYCALEENDSDAQLFLTRMNEPDTQAAILLGIDDPHIHDLAVDVAKPCILINCRDRHMRLPAVTPDHRAIGERAAEYLFEMGHREVLNVMCLRRYTMELRLSGIRDAWQSHNLKFNDLRDLLVVPSFSARETEELVNAWLIERQGKDLPTAFLVGGDFMAAGTISALQKHGLRVPQDVSVMSIDGFNLAAIQDVPLTAVHVPRDELGTEAVYMLQQRLMRPDAPVGTLLLNGTLAVRESVRRIRQGKRRTAVDREGLYDS
ncbi:MULTISPECIES: LacI family DNA-binding transcriptional regulator [Citrobacter]|uniref:LacI family DNA-binding transcriptional regulator n=1 Tax=Citrobacter cronae TaxID=1748967 RepID=A0ABS1A7J0_9ENTR|nr:MULTISPECIES: LacI family DNA-binding transcriptional regulator [Citrobacter]AHY12628.1 cytochrome C peroxidase [Citrobacter freundii CFNIH1]AWS98659.1 LacI family transcriptional regulator [Citrobacter sp. CRE-46]KAA0557746.1 LacI family transcriptional regulator [Citrobacter werkmanii]MBD0819990.1 LacI family DNA-binding transcriptional regulator [Citrobacter sp. C5_2]MBJ8373324.1 LacI family DNA-binding transcriptional regulator [Citrobacter cronae]